MTAARIACHLARKLIKPFALWLAEVKQSSAEAQAEHYRELRADLVGMELNMRKHAVVLAERCNEIARW